MAPDPPPPPRSDEAWSASPDPDPDHSRFHLPPHTLADDAALYEGDAPNVLADNLLLHPPPTRRPEIGSRSTSWQSAIWPQPPPPPPPPPPPHRPPPWYKRPSPVWFFPGTLVIALTMGMTIAPKLEIYTQLICRALPVNESGVTVPPPIIELGAHRPLAASSSPGPGTGPVYYHLEWQPNLSPPPTTTPAEERASATPISNGEWAKQCHKSRAVQSQVAQLALLLSLLMGILSSLTTGYWGAFSDRRGRKPVLILALCGSLAMDVVFLLTIYFHSTLSYNFLLLGPILDGLVGGYSTAQATSAAYISDTTLPGSRAKIFSAIGGLMYGGFALGPVLGSFLITRSRLGVLAPFYAALAIHAGYLLFLAVLLPESLSPERRQSARERHAAERVADDADSARTTTRRWERAVHLATKPLAFLKPVALLLPRTRRRTTRKRPAARGAGPERPSHHHQSHNHHKVRNEPTGTNSPTKDDDEDQEDQEEEEEDDRTNIEWGAHLSEYWNPEEVWNSADPGGDGQGGKIKKGRGGERKDWTLTKIAAAWACYMCIMAVMSVKLMYANYTFGWGAAEDGYYLSFLGVLRVVMLVGLIPLIIKLVRRKPAPIPLRPRPDPDTDADGAAAATTTWDHEKRWLRVVHDSHFDLALARWSLVLDLFGFALFLAAPWLVPASGAGGRGSSEHVALFLTAAVLQSMGSGASPAIQSLALAHASPRDAGRLFASLSVVQSIASQVVGPILFSVLFMRTVGRWSEAVFALASALAALAVLALSLVRLRTVVVLRSDQDLGGGGGGEEDSLSRSAAAGGGGGGGAGRLGRGPEFEFDTEATPRAAADLGFLSSSSSSSPVKDVSSDDAARSTLTRVRS